MTRYVVGDIQGCYLTLLRLLEKIKFDITKDILYLVGDLVSRGPRSLEVLQWVYNNRDRVKVVLGNHDFYLIARHAKIKTIVMEKNDNLDATLQYNKIDELITWLRSCPIIYNIDQQFLLVHAGIHPFFVYNTLCELNAIAQQQLQGDNYRSFLEKIYSYGNITSLTVNSEISVNDYNTIPKDEERLRQLMSFFINSCIRMRCLKRTDNSLDYSYKSELNLTPDALIPWFNVRPHTTVLKKGEKIIFGHWSALGFYENEYAIALDTGCVWGRRLTALNLDSFIRYSVPYCD